MVAAAVLSTPFAAFTTSQGSLTPSVVMLGIAVAGLSSVLPYTLELMALRRLETTTFAVLMSLGPAIAALAGFVVLGQTLAPTQALAVVVVITASIGAVGTSSR